MKKIVFIILLACFSVQAQKPSPMKGGAIINWNGEPSFHVAGWLLYDTSENQLKVSNGTSWIDINGGFDADIVGESLLLSTTMNQQGLKFDVSENNNGVYNILLNANNETNPGLNLGLGSGNYNVTFWDYLDNKLLEITPGYIRAPSLTIAQQSNAKSLVTLEKVQDLISSGSGGGGSGGGGSGGFNTAGDYTLSGNWVFDNPVEVADPTTVDEAVNLRYFNSNVPSDVVPFLEIDASTYTITESQIENFTQLYISDNQTDVTLTLPSTTLTGQQFISVQHLGTGTITIIPDTGVNLQQYVSTSTQSFVLGSIVQNEWFVKNGSVTASTYTPPITATNLITNSALADGSNITFQDWRWLVVANKFVFNGTSQAVASFDLTEAVVSGGTYDITFEVSDIEASKTARFDLHFGGTAGQQIATFTTYAATTHTISYTHSSADASIFTIDGSNSAGGGGFSIFNISVLKTN